MCKHCLNDNEFAEDLNLIKAGHKERLFRGKNGEDDD